MKPKKNKEYDHKKIEPKWQKEWAKNKIYHSTEKAGAPKAYVLDMFPYPSGEGLHVGHPKGYIATDVYSRFKKMSGFNVLHPMGWDAFGLPAENYAIKNKVHPRKAVEKNIKRYKEQLSVIGFNYDWSREINTTDPKYYKWTQWIFLKLLERGLAYQSFEPINWCPSCQTGLANEDLEDGKCERCGSVVEKKPMRQWVLKITDYAERLLSDLDPLNWPESIKESQRNWIGKSEGAEIPFKLEIATENQGAKKQTLGHQIAVFTTRPETIFGATALVLAPEHPWVTDALAIEGGGIQNPDAVKKYIVEARKKTEIDRAAIQKEKSGVKLEGINAVNPATKEEIPVFIADYVLATHGTGAVMSVPAHDDRDFDFAQTHGLKIKQVIAPLFVDQENLPVEGKEWSPRKNVMAVVKHPTEDKIIQIQWKKQPWKTLVIGGVEGNETYEDAVRREVTEETGYKNFKSITKLGWQMESHFFARHKDVNRQAFPQAFLVELSDLQKNELTKEENETHEIAWVSIEELTSKSKSTYWPVTERSEIVEYLERGPHAFTRSGKMINSGKFDGTDSTDPAMISEIISFVGGRKVTTYKLRDWVFSRQRYWGEPIPVIHCEKCGVVPVPEKDLPVKLPDVKKYAPTGTGESPLADISKWVNVKCPTCRGKAKRETNTMPQWAGSSWYYLRFMDSKNAKKLVDPKKEAYWSPVDVYVGGAEHATRHLIYARFWHKFLFDQGVVGSTEPFARLHNVGLILAEDGRKMSKRFGNVINPDDIVETYGADTFRIYEMFMGPFAQASAWDTKSIMGSRRFLERVWRIAEKVADSGEKRGANGLKSENAVATELQSENDQKAFHAHLHKTIAKVSNDIETFSFNTAISSLMVLSREFENQESVNRADFEKFLQILSPLAPHVTEELWSATLGNKKSIYESAWPQVDPSKITTETAKIMIQVNGKVRGECVVEFDADESKVKAVALELESIKKWLTNSPVTKIFFVKNRLINFVTG